MSIYVKIYDDQTKCIYFLIEGDHILKKHSNIWVKFSAELDRELVYNEIFWNTKIKYYGDEVSNFHSKKILWSYFFSSNHYKFCSQKDQNYYPKAFLKEWKYIEQVVRHITQDLEILSEFDEE